jgi:hypothetical protein
MPLTEESKNLFIAHKGTPIVGLINKTTYDIVLAPCIPQKVRLNLNSLRQAVSGKILNYKCEEVKDINEIELVKCNQLLDNGYLPRLAYEPPREDEVKSAHEFLFERQSIDKTKSQWGGFALTVDVLDKVEYTFASGAFNSKPGKRTRGAELSENLVAEVKKQISDFGYSPKRIEIKENAELTSQICSEAICTTPDKKRPRTSNYGGILFPAVVGTNDAIYSSPQSKIQL